MDTGFYRPGYPESARYKPRIFSFRSVDAGDGVELFVSNHVLHMAIEHERTKTVYEFSNYVFQMRRYGLLALLAALFAACALSVRPPPASSDPSCGPRPL